MDDRGGEKLDGTVVDFLHPEATHLKMLTNKL